MPRGDFLRSLFRIFASPGLCLAAALIVSTPAISAVFSDYPAKFHDPRFAVTAADQIHMLAPIGHATTMEPVPLEDADGDPVNSVNRKSGMTAGTVFMVSPCIALTNYHVVFGQAREQPGSSSREYKVKVSVGGETGIGIPFIWGDFAQGRENDWAAVRVTPCIGSSVGWLPIALTRQQLPREVSIFGFYTDQDYSVLMGQDCVLIERVLSSKIWTTNCAMVHGTSGSPLGVFLQGTFQATAIAFAMSKTQSTTYEPQGANLAVDLSEIFLNTPSLAATIADELKSYGKPNPAKLGTKRPPIEPPAIAPVTASQPAGLPTEPQLVELPPTPRPIGLPPDPKPIALPPDPQPIALPPTPAPAKP